MQTKTFTYNKSNQRMIALLFLGLGLLGTALALYMWLCADPILLTVFVGGILLAILGIIVFIKLMLAPKKENEIVIAISKEGITAHTTPVAKAAGLIQWEDIESINLLTKSIEVKLKNPEKYAARMKNFFVRDTFLKPLKGTVKISYMETHATYDELREILAEHTQ